MTRVTPLTGEGVPHPILYALDPQNHEALWISTPEMLNVGGKYNTPAFRREMVFVGTDRIQAFGVRRETTTRRPLIRQSVRPEPTAMITRGS